MVQKQQLVQRLVEARTRMPGGTSRLLTLLSVLDAEDSNGGDGEGASVAVGAREKKALREVRMALKAALQGHVQVPKLE